MLTIDKSIAQGRGLAKVLLARAPAVELDWDTRSKSRFEATDSSGRRLGVFLPRGSVLRGGDVLVAEDGSLVLVRAAPQPLLRVRACAEHGSPLDLARAAYHLGNRHVTLEVRAEHLQLEPDPVLADLLRQMHLIVAEVNEPFEPEAGAYAAALPAGGHGHEHRHDPGHESGHAHRHESGPGHGHDGHCGHDHGHDDEHHHHGQHRHHGHDDHRH